MSFDWQEYYNLARELATQPADAMQKEARLRSAISRAYYAAFIEARNYLLYKDNTSIPVGVNPHDYVYRHFLRSSSDIRKKIGKQLHNLRRERNRADYDNTFVKLAGITRKSLRAAEEIITNLGRL